MTSLIELHAEIDARVESIRSQRSDWPCSKGCDRCCRNLAEVPRLTGAEWALLEQGLATLPQAQMQVVGARIAALSVQSPGPVVCPMLDHDNGACQVYHHRPVACRSYGFYVQRDLGLYCNEIKANVADGLLAEVVWGNHDGIDRQLTQLGTPRALTEWFVEGQRTSPKE